VFRLFGPRCYAVGFRARTNALMNLPSTWRADASALVVGDIQAEPKIPASTLSHHLDKLRCEGLPSGAAELTFATLRSAIVDAWSTRRRFELLAKTSGILSQRFVFCEASAGRRTFFRESRASWSRHPRRARPDQSLQADLGR
jgi:Bacterial regulatory protein, arsR family